MRKLWLFPALLWWAALPVQAVEVPDLYTATVPVADQSDAARGDALSRALEVVIGRVAGDPQAAKFSGAATVLERARSLVQQYGYQGSQAAGLKLRAAFDGESVTRAVRDAGLPVWGRERPQTVLWLALGDRLLTVGGPEAVVAAVRQTAEAHGVPVRLPRAEEASSGRVTPGDIRTRNDTRLTAVSMGYDGSYLLVGAARGVGDGWQADWRLLREGREMRSWSDAAGSRADLVAQAVAHMAGVYASRFAVRGSGEIDAVMVAVAGVAGASGYTRVSDYLRDLTVVDAVSPLVIDGQSVVFRVQAAGGLDSLERSIGLADWLARDEVARNLAGLYGTGGPALGYRFRR